MNVKLHTILVVAALSLASTRPALAADRCDELWAAAMADDVKHAADLINAGVVVNCRDVLTAETPLMAAAKNGGVDLVKLLLRLGADASIKNASGSTALDLVRNMEATMSKMPAFAALAERQRQVIALLQPLATGTQKPVDPVKVVPTDVNQVARMKLEGVRGALMARQYDSAANSILEVTRMAGVSERWKAHAYALGGELGVRTQDWPLAKAMCEKVISLTEADEDDRVSSIEMLKILRKDHPELFKP